MSTLIEKTKKDKNFWAALLVLSLALCLWGYFHPYARLGFSLLPILLCANYKALIEEWHKGIPKWILYPWAVILIFSLSHLVYSKALTDALGVLLIILGLGIYLLARTMPNELRKWLAVLAIIGSIALIINRIYDTQTISPGILGLYHSAAFAILIGIVAAQGRLKWWTTLFGIPAIVLSGSEEGLLALAVVMIYLGIQSITTDKPSTVRHFVLPILIIVPIVAAGLVDNMYLSLSNRIDNPTNGRWAAYTDLATQPDILIAGQGWYWDTVGTAQATDNIYQTIHNAPLRIAVQYGIIAGLAWLFIFLIALFKLKQHRAIFLIILCFAFLDHFMWGSAIAWCWALLGVCHATYMVKDNAGVASIADTGRNGSIGYTVRSIILRDGKIPATKSNY